MDDLFNSLHNILNSQEGQEQLNELSKMFSDQNISNDKDPQHNNKNDSNNSGSSNSGFDFSGIDINMIMYIGQIMDSLNQEDKNTTLLKALKPHFAQSKQDKIDNAIKILKIISLIPVLKESGILGGLFSDGSK